MSKRLLSTDKRTEAILDYIKKNNANISSYVCGSVLDEFLPVYSSLRIEALYLLDYVIDGAREWKGNKLVFGADDDEKDYIIRQTLGRSVYWLKRNHKIKKSGVIRDIVLYFCESELSGGVTLKELNDNEKKYIDAIKGKLKEIDSDYNYIGLGGLALEILDRWDEFWEYDAAYDVIISVIYREKMKFGIEPMVVIKLVQNIENQFIIEAIGEK